MPRKSPYKLNDGTIVHGVTTIINRFNNSEPLINWANKQGLKGKKVADIQNEAFKDGSEVHFIFENIVKRKKFSYDPKYNEFAKKVRKRLNQIKVRTLLSELPFVSEEHKFGGTPDLIFLLCNNSNRLYDLKFANYISVSNIFQLAAYRILYKENTLNEIHSAEIFHFHKKAFIEQGITRIDIIPITKGELIEYGEAFLKMNELYPQLLSFDKQFKKINNHIMRFN